MTRTEFDENITTWSELIDFCNDNSIYICEDVIDAEERDSQINSDLADFVRREDWTTVWETLDDIPTGYSHYRRDGEFEYTALDDYGDFDDYKDEVGDYCDRNGLWDPEEDEEEYEDEEILECEDENDSDEFEPAEEPFAIGELYTVCSGVLHSITRKSEEFEKEVNSAFDDFVMNFVPAETKRR